SLAMETPKRKKYLNFTTPYLKVPLVLATKMDVPFVNDFKTLSEHKLGIPKGYAFIELLQNKYPNLNIVEVENVKDGLQKVIDNELYGYIGTLPSVGYLFQSDFVGQLKIAGKFDESWSLGTAVRDDDRILLQIMNKLIYNLDETAKSKILSNSFSIKYQQDIDYSVVYKVLVFIMVVALFFIYRQYILKNQNKRLKTLVDERTKDLNELNKNLEDKVEEKTKELLQQEETFRLLFDIAPIFIDSFDKDGRCVLWNKECEKVFGWTIDDINRSKNSLELFYPDPKVQKDAIDTIINKPEKIFREWYPLNKKGETLVTMWAHIYLPNGEIINVGYDITEEKAKDKLLAEQLKMAAMGEMIGNIAHQWRQPLSVISTASSGMQIQKEYGILTDEQFIESCKAINSNTQFLSKTIDNFRDFIKNDKVKSTFKLDNAIGSFINIVEATIKIDNINMVFDLQENINIDSFQNELIQCLINIFHNSDDVLSKNKLEDKFIFLSTSLKNNKVIIKIKDNGGGIDDDILPKIFEPYFTTKHQSQGTGLGLHMTYNSIVNGMDGTIEANNIAFEYNGKEYTGAEFTITLPAN
ncbi:MAG: ATP-binding protein, partial [Campylobacterota bacterium]|nr:ATP-binding protein [Campylobacterota bacterium]